MYIDIVRKCRACDGSFPLTEEFFYRQGVKRDRFSWKCKPCYKKGFISSKIQRRRLKELGVPLPNWAKSSRRGKPSEARKKEARKSRRQLIGRIKMEKGCADCGFNSHHAALDFDHLPGNKKVNSIAKMVSDFKNIDVITEEIGKCEVVCANCHRIRTFKRMASARAAKAAQKNSGLLTNK